MFVRMATFKDGYPSTPDPLTHTPPLFHKLRLLNIFDIFKLQLGKLVCKSTNGIGPLNIVIKFSKVSNIPRHNTRYASRGNVFINSVRITHFGLKGLQIAKLWATLAWDIKNSHTKNCLKSHFKKKKKSPM